jgi:hypothetical protein
MGSSWLSRKSSLTPHQNQRSLFLSSSARPWGGEWEKRLSFNSLFPNKKNKKKGSQHLKRRDPGLFHPPAPAPHWLHRNGCERG